MDRNFVNLMGKVQKTVRNFQAGKNQELSQAEHFWSKYFVTFFTDHKITSPPYPCLTVTPHLRPLALTVWLLRSCRESLPSSAGWQKHSSHYMNAEFTLDRHEGVVISIPCPFCLNHICLCKLFVITSVYNYYTNRKTKSTHTTWISEEIVEKKLTCVSI